MHQKRIPFFGEVAACAALVIIKCFVVSQCHRDPKTVEVIGEFGHGTTIRWSRGQPRNVTKYEIDGINLLGNKIYVGLDGADYSRRLKVNEKWPTDFQIKIPLAPRSVTSTARVDLNRHTYLMPNLLKSQPLSRVRMSNVFASGELSGNKDGIFYKLNPPVYSVLTHVNFVRAISGSEAEKFRVFAHANNGTKEFVGEFPKVADTLFLTWPPMYPGVAVLEIHPNRATAAEAGQHTVLQSLGNSSTRMRMPVTTCYATGTRQTHITIGERSMPVSPQQTIAIRFAPDQSGQLNASIDQNGSSFRIEGRAALEVNVDGTSHLQRRIEEWSWYIQATIWAIAGALVSCLGTVIKSLLRPAVDPRKAVK